MGVDAGACSALRQRMVTVFMVGLHPKAQGAITELMFAFGFTHTRQTIALFLRAAMRKYFM